MLIFPEVRQTYNYDCGAKVTQAVLAYYGIDIREDIIIKLVGTKRSGTPIKGIIRAFKKHGLKYKVEKSTINKIRKCINKKIPVILVLQAWTDKKNVNWETDWIDGHYVIAIGYDKNRIYFEDPSSVLRTFLTYDELKERWHGIDPESGKKYINYGIIVYGKRNTFSFKKAVRMG